MVNRIDGPFRINWKDLERFISSSIDDIHLGSMTLIDLLQMIFEVLEQVVFLNCSVVPGSIQFGTCVEALGQLVSEKGTTIEERHKEACSLKAHCDAESMEEFECIYLLF